MVRLALAGGATNQGDALGLEHLQALINGVDSFGKLDETSMALARKMGLLSTWVTDGLEDVDHPEHQGTMKGQGGDGTSAAVGGGAIGRKLSRAFKSLKRGGGGDGVEEDTQFELPPKANPVGEPIFGERALELVMKKIGAGSAGDAEAPGTHVTFMDMGGQVEFWQVGHRPHGAYVPLLHDDVASPVLVLL